MRWFHLEPQPRLKPPHGEVHLDLEEALHLTRYFSSLKGRDPHLVYVHDALKVHGNHHLDNGVNFCTTLLMVCQLNKRFNVLAVCWLYWSPGVL